MKCIDSNCITCSESSTICTECKNGYYLEENKCKLKCDDSNCNFCLKEASICTECKSETKLYNGKCALSEGKCHEQYLNCKYCLNEEGCIECNEGYKIKITLIKFV